LEGYEKQKSSQTSIKNASRPSRIQDLDIKQLTLFVKRHITSPTANLSLEDFPDCSNQTLPKTSSAAVHITWDQLISGLIFCFFISLLF
jgi:hypothetical protein